LSYCGVRGIKTLPWTRRNIVAEIRHLHAGGEELNYASAELRHLNLVRAAAWHFGSWRTAVERAGFDYGELSKYQRWNRERIIERIRELHAQQADLSWREVSLHLDPALAAAALRPNGFQSWREAIEAAGLNIEQVARYAHWDDARVLEEISALQQAGEALSSKAVQQSHQGLFCAARRRFGSWDNALEVAGLDISLIRLRAPRHRTGAGKSRRKPNSSSPKTAKSKAAKTSKPI
jgi:hypothetical protein